MKKMYFFLSFILLTAVGFSQGGKETIANKEIGTVSCAHMRGPGEKGETLVYVNLSFQNGARANTVDIKFVMVPVAEVPAFIEDLKAAYKEMGKKANTSWDRKRYNLTLYDHSKNLYLYSEKKGDTGYTILTPKQVAELIAWLEGLSL